MVLSEIAAATMIAICGLKKSYRIVLSGERQARRYLRRPQPMIAGRDSMPRSFIRHVFKAGHGIALKWEGRAQNAAQRARAARLRAYEARERVGEGVQKVREVSEGVKGRVKAVGDGMREAKERAGDARRAVGEGIERARARAEGARKRVEDVGDRLGQARDAARGAVRRAGEVGERVGEGVRKVRLKFGERRERGGIAGVLKDVEKEERLSAVGKEDGEKIPVEDNMARAIGGMRESDVSSSSSETDCGGTGSTEEEKVEIVRELLGEKPARGSSERPEKGGGAQGEADKGKRQNL